MAVAVTENGFIYQHLKSASNIKRLLKGWIHYKEEI